ncbi:MAG: T9SS type A sorting domain-containing protein [Sphingobacteriales bacterium]|nr:T9SS type A sorting domain-containing protein [Sphingobacteriales bacterium]
MTCLILSFQTDLLAKAAYDLPRQEAPGAPNSPQWQPRRFEAHALLYMLYGEEFRIPLPLLPDAAATFIGTNNLGSIAFKMTNNNVGDNYLKVMPNPAANSVDMSYHIPDNETANWQLYSVSGQLMMQKALQNSGMLHMDLSQIPNGMYYYLLHCERGVLASNKLVVIK